MRTDVCSTNQYVNQSHCLKKKTNGMTFNFMIRFLLAAVFGILPSSFNNSIRPPPFIAEAFTFPGQVVTPSSRSSKSNFSAAKSQNLLRLTCRTCRNGGGSCGTSSLSLSLLDTYCLCLQDYPLPTQAITASFMAGAGDILAQISSSFTSSSTAIGFNASSRQKVQPLLFSVLFSSSTTLPTLPTLPSISTAPLDFTRLQRFMLKGLGGGLLWSFWFSTSDRLVAGILEQLQWLPTSSSATLVVVDVVRTAAFILLEQFLWCPIVFSLWEIPVPYLLASSEEKQRLGPMSEQIQTKLPRLLVDNAKLWTIVNMFVYNIPVQYRVLLSSTADIVWMMIVSQTVMGNDRSVTEEEVEQFSLEEGQLLEDLLSSGDVESSSEDSITEEDTAELSTSPELLHY